MIAGLVDDPIPNIRFNVAKALESLIPILEEKTKGESETEPLSKFLDKEVQPVLAKLSTDVDADVRYFATRAMTTAGEFEVSMTEMV